jgi:hypothetical protein
MDCGKVVLTEVRHVRAVEAYIRDSKWCVDSPLLTNFSNHFTK